MRIEAEQEQPAGCSRCIRPGSIRSAERLVRQVVRTRSAGRTALPRRGGESWYRRGFFFFFFLSFLGGPGSAALAQGPAATTIRWSWRRGLALCRAGAGLPHLLASPEVSFERRTDAGSSDRKGEITAAALVRSWRPTSRYRRFAKIPVARLSRMRSCRYGPGSGDAAFVPMRRPQTVIPGRQAMADTQWRTLLRAYDVAQ